MKRKTRYAAAGLALALLASGCGSTDGVPDDDDGTAAADDAGDDNDAEVTTITVSSLPSLSNVVLFLAADKYGEEYGVDIQIEIASRGDEIFQAVISGDAELGVSTGATAFNSYAEGLPITYVAPVNYAFNEDYFLVSSELAADAEAAAAMISDLSALQGQPVAASAPGAMTDYALNALLPLGGLSGGIADVDVQHFPFPDHIAALANGSVLASATSEPSATIAEDQGAAFRPFATPTDPDDAVLTLLLVANTDWAAENDEEMQAFMNAYAAAAAQIAEEGWHTEEAVEAASQLLDIDAELIGRTRPQTIPADLRVDFDDIAAEQEFFMEMGFLNYDELVAPEEMFDLSWAEAAVAEVGSR